MRIETPLVTRSIEHWEFRFVSGLPLGVDVDYESGDTVTGGPEDGSIDICIASKTSPVDGETKLAGKNYTIYTDQLAYVERFIRQVVDLTPEQQREQKVMIKNLVEQGKQAKIH